MRNLPLRMRLLPPQLCSIINVIGLNAPFSRCTLSDTPSGSGPLLAGEVWGIGCTLSVKYEKFSTPPAPTFQRRQTFDISSMVQREGSDANGSIKAGKMSAHIRKKPDADDTPIKREVFLEGKQSIFYCGTHQKKTHKRIEDGGTRTHARFL